MDRKYLSHSTEEFFIDFPFSQADNKTSPNTNPIAVLIGIYIAFDIISNKNLKISSFLKKDMNKFILSIFLTIILILIIAKIIELFS